MTHTLEQSYKQQTILHNPIQDTHTHTHSNNPIHNTQSYTDPTHDTYTHSNNPTHNTHTHTQLKFVETNEYGR